MRILVVIPHYGPDAHLARLLPSLGVEAPPAELLSSSRQIVASFPYGEICIINNNSGNNGFTKACNEGIRYGINKGFDAVWLLNNDTEVPNVREAVHAFWEEFQAHPNTGVIGCKNLLLSNPDFIHHGGTEAAFPVGIHKQGWVSRGDLNARTEEKWVTGASFIISSSCLQKTGLLDERYVNCASDSDYCYSARQAGFDVIYLPVPILHAVGGSNLPRKDATLLDENDARHFEKKWIAPELASIDQKGMNAYAEGRYGEALSCALELRARGIWNPGTAFNAAQCLHILGRTPEALQIMEELHRDFPESTDYAFYLSACLSALGNFERAERILAPLPDTHQMIVSHRGMHLLRKGYYREGHAMLQSAERFTPLETAFPGLISEKRYQPGMPLKGKRLLLIQENGLGDAVMCARFVEDYAKQGAIVSLGTSPLLTPLFQRLPYPPFEIGDARALIRRGAYDYYLPDSASEHMRVLNDFEPVLGKTIPYIKSHPDFENKWAHTIQARAQGRPKIGIHWKGSRSGGEMFYPRDIPFHLLPRFSELGALFSFQRDAGVSDLASHTEILDLGTQFETLEDSAGALAHMDYLITGCVFIAHLAGAMGKKVAFIAAVDAHYTWFDINGYSEWYPSVRVFRQPAFRASEAPLEAAYRWIQSSEAVKK